MYDVCSKTKGRGMAVYHELVLGMAVFDLVTAVAWSFASTPVNDSEGYEVYGAHGTNASCRAQGKKKRSVRYAFAFTRWFVP